MILAIQNRFHKLNILHGPKSINIVFILFLAADLEAIFKIFRQVHDLSPYGISRA